ncbi:hypothetical protein DV515_00015475 [Chloebia gouldiae]|uniref:Uncharacterized protein n=1 Tax=Chloebia gouldiae TaxID=44316 RepID=A0A3L8RWF4_CHLGU|nr:hypothetical protein DV515_00015475 [Chloebia gouldiae]
MGTAGGRGIGADKQQADEQWWSQQIPWEDQGTRQHHMNSHWHSISSQDLRNARPGVKLKTAPSSSLL